jgi:hypothetical protein
MHGAAVSASSVRSNRTFGFEWEKPGSDAGLFLLMPSRYCRVDTAAKPNTPCLASAGPHCAGGDARAVVSVMDDA